MIRTRIVFALVCVIALRCAHAGVCTSQPMLRKYDGYSSYGTADKRESVKALQNILNEKGGYGLEADGYFGSNTESAVRQFQTANSLVIDGIVGPQTWGALCEGETDDGGSDSCNVDNPNGASISTTGWTARTQFVVNNILECFPAKFWCGGETRNDPDSDHSRGNAADCFPGNSGVKVTGEEKSNGDALAAWATENAASLKVRYVIWYKRIWNIERSDEGWRECGTESTCYGGSDPTAAHYDHVHISVY